MKSDLPEDLDTLIEREKRALAEECCQEVWTELLDEGIDPSLIAEIFMESALKCLVRERGNDQATRLIAHFREMDERGLLPTIRTLQ
ncbi:MAG: hypothetical protein AAF423_09980 [Pseudomonadota bacterium]